MAIKNASIRHSPTYGQAASATRHLQPGDIVFEEEPVFTVPPPVEVKSLPLLDAIVCASQIQPGDIDAQVQLLSDEQRDFYSKVAHDEDTNLSRFLCVHYDLRPRHSEAPTQFGYFPLGAYVNHSCQPNAMYRWDEKRRCIRFFALTDIAEGDEILVCYLPMYDWENVAERRAILRRLFPFDCICSLCQSELKDQSASAAREQIREIHRQLSGTVASSNSTSPPTDKTPCLNGDAVGTAYHYLDLLDRNLDLSKSVDPRVYRGYYLASSIFSRNGDSQKATTLQARAVEVLSKCFDRDTEQFQAERALCEKLYPVHDGSKTEVNGSAS